MGLISVSTLRGETRRTTEMFGFIISKRDILGIKISRISRRVNLLLNTLLRLKQRQILYLVIRRLLPKTFPFKKRGRSLKISRLRLPRMEFCCSSYIAVDSRDSVSMLGSPYAKLSEGPQHEYRDYLIPFSWYYLDWLNLEQLSNESKRLALEKHVFEQGKRGKWWAHPYTASKRIQSITVFLSQRPNLDKEDSNFNKCVVRELKASTEFLLLNLEKDIDANHLLTNFCSLAMVSAMTADHKLLDYEPRYEKEFEKQFKTEFHYERSWCYSLQLVYECLLYMQLRNRQNLRLEHRVGRILLTLGWMRDFGVQNFGDGIKEQTPNYEDVCQLFENISKVKLNDLSEPGSIVPPFIGTFKALDYYFLSTSRFRVVLDCGIASPKFQPGHAHDSAGAICLSYKDELVVVSHVNTTYEKGIIRALQRSRRSYSKPQSTGSSVELWSAFRTGRSLKPEVISFSNFPEIETRVAASNGAFKRLVRLEHDRVSVVDKFEDGNKPRSQFILSEQVKAKELGQSGVGLYIDDRLFLVVMTNTGTILKIHRSLGGNGYGSFGEKTKLVCMARTPDTSLETTWRSIE